MQDRATAHPIYSGKVVTSNKFGGNSSEHEATSESCSYYTVSLVFFILRSPSGLDQDMSQEVKSLVQRKLQIWGWPKVPLNTLYMP